MELVSFFKTGGVTMYPLLLCSILTWAIFFERLWSLFRFRREFFRVSGKVADFLKEGKQAEAIGICENTHDSVAAPLLILLKNKDITTETRDAKVVRRLHETQASLRRYLWLLGSIGALAPFIGLFGTVMGIIRSFESIAVAGKSGFSVVAAGLSEALITTAAGILIAVFAVFFYNYFQTRLSSLGLELRNKMGDLSDLL